MRRAPTAAMGILEKCAPELPEHSRREDQRLDSCGTNASCRIKEIEFEMARTQKNKVRKVAVFMRSISAILLTK